uniref:Lysozyme g n=1 Tax=Nothobranchius rachovii TaxID=451742 RepID=A0A1A8QSG7_9TELE
MTQSEFCLCVLSYLLLLAEGRPLEPTQVFAAARANAVLPCAVSLSEVTVLEWLHLRGSARLSLHAFMDGKQLMEDQTPEYKDRTSLKEDGSLTLQHVHQNDTGEYRCVFRTGVTRTFQEVKVSLIVVQLSDVSVKIHRTPTRGLVLECEGSSWGLKLDVSIRDVQGNVLANKTGMQEVTDGLHTAVVRVAEDEQTEDVLLVCRAEVSEVKLVKETKIWITDDFRAAAAPGGSLVFPLVLIVFGAVGLCLSICLFICPWNVRTKAAHQISEFLCRMCSRMEEGFQDISTSDKPGELTEYRTLNQMTAKGASNRETGWQSSVEMSRRLAEQDLQRLSPYKNDILDVGRGLHFHPALIAAIISRQSRAGEELKEDGYGKHDPNSFGLMQISKNFHVLKGEPFSKVHIDSGTTYLIHLVKTMTQQKSDWTLERQLKGALVGYISGIEKVLAVATEELDLDSLTPTQDFTNDVIARAQFFAEREYQI